ncbi:MAG: gliding motility-associated C-terminal domain-containing protein [Bacteroidia bacterium]
MKYITFYTITCILLFSCKKQEQVNPDDTITYTHWYKMRSDSLDTLFSVYIPNAFSPNGDGKNDYFFVRGYFNLKELKIMSRNNNVVFKTNSFHIYWDGSQNYSNTIMIGTYVYKLTVSDSINREYEYTGIVTLFR